jgi:hypothetical protein
LRRNCLLKHCIKGKIEGVIEMTDRQGWGRKQLLEDLKERRICLKLKEAALHRTLWRTHFGSGCGPVVRQATKWMNEWMNEHYWNFVTCWNQTRVLYWTSMPMFSGKFSSPELWRTSRLTYRKFNFYLTVNILHLHYKDRTFIVAEGNNYHLFCCSG